MKDANAPGLGFKCERKKGKGRGSGKPERGDQKLATQQTSGGKDLDTGRRFGQRKVVRETRRRRRRPRKFRTETRNGTWKIQDGAKGGDLGRALQPAHRILDIRDALKKGCYWPLACAQGQEGKRVGILLY